jgi:hypothetical protein
MRITSRGLRMPAPGLVGFRVFFHVAKLALASASLVVTGCTVIVPPPPPPHPPQGPAVNVAQGAVNGEPKQGVKPNSGLGMHIWRGDDGKWHLRSATDGKLHKFRGTIDGASSPVNWYDAEWMEIGDSMGKRGDGLVFLFETGGHLDGLTFVPDDHGCVTFHITVDERSQPERIFLGRDGIHPTSDHFTACP